MDLVSALKPGIPNRRFIDYLSLKREFGPDPLPPSRVPVGQRLRGVELRSLAIGQLELAFDPGVLFCHDAGDEQNLELAFLCDRGLEVRLHDGVVQ